MNFTDLVYEHILNSRRKVGRHWQRWTDQYPWTWKKNRIACNHLMKLVIILVRRLLFRGVIAIYQSHI